MSSLKMTFSLTSLIFLIALGLVFVPTSVMAHEVTAANSAIDEVHEGDTPVQVITDGVVTTSGNTNHGAHPRVTSIALKPGDNVRGNEVVVTADDTNTATVSENTFILVITFDQALTAAVTETTASTTSPLVADDIELTILNKDGVAVATDGTTPATAEVSNATITRMTGDKTNAKFEAVVTIGGSYPSGMAANDHEKYILRVSVNARAGFSVATRPGHNVVPGGPSYESSVYPFILVKELGDAPTPTTGAEGKITGTASLENPFPITITFAKAGVMLEAGDITVTGGGRLSEGSLYNDTPDDATDMTVYKAAIEPFTNAAQAFGFITITLKTTAKVKPAAADMGGTLTVRADGDLVSITAPDDANDEAPFVVTLTFAKSLANTVMVMKEDLDVMPKDDMATAGVNEGAMIGDIAPVLGTDRKMWQVEITPVKGQKTTVALSEEGKVKFGSSTAMATVNVKSSAPPSVITAVDATYSATDDETTLKGMLAANGFAVISAADLPDIQRFFAEGGSISVLSAKAGAVAKDVVISEIMWGLNLRAVGATRTANQFIELYNTTGATIDLKDVKLDFNDANTPPAAPTGMTLLDQVSNVSGVGWVITDAPGQSGRIALANDVTTFVPSNLISMYRKIDYVKVMKTHDADDAAKNREAQLKDFPDGSALGNWEASNPADTYGVNLIGSPGKRHFVAYAVLTPTNVPRGKFIINEIGNYANDAYDWVEIKRKGGDGNLKKWRLSEVRADKSDNKLVSFPDNDDHKIAADGDVLLIVNSDPYQDPNHPLAAGTGINAPAKNRAETTGVKSRYYVDSGLKLSNSGKTLLILRDSVDDGHLGKSNNIQDVVGTLQITDSAATLRTDMWPLVATGKPHGNVIDGTDDEDFRSGKVYRRANEGGGTGEKHMAVVGYSGIGYKRSATNSGQNGGTPGYPNNAHVDTSDLADGAMVSISEIMYAKNRNEPQWIELHNSSMTQAVNLNEWKLKIEHDRNVEDIDIRTSVTTNNLGGSITIQPNQTVLIVSNTTGRTSRASQGGVDFPATRVINLWAQKDKLEVDSGVTRLTYKFLSQKAFKITLLDKGGSAVDVAGNLGATKAWDLPASDPDNGEGRSSIIRRYVEGEPSDGTMEDSWVFARDSHLTWVRFNETYYGSPDDIGTPGFRAGGPLPVSLSKFRPERLKDTGEVVVRWITESELNNAGFNILRSEKRDSDFEKVHFEAGKGTTSERTVYEWKDKSAKPNVVYYYQIQDVSLDGDVTTLRVTHLRGNVTAAGKLTTTWGEIKALQ